MRYSLSATAKSEAVMDNQTGVLHDRRASELDRVGRRSIDRLKRDDLVALVRLKAATLVLFSGLPVAWTALSVYGLFTLTTEWVVLYCTGVVALTAVTYGLRLSILPGKP
jgi:hypothetical protein